MVSSEGLRQAMEHFVTGVTIITTTEANGEVHGMTANAFTSVSLAPPLVLVCIGHQRNTYKNVCGCGRFGINVLNDTHKDIASYYAQGNKDKECALQAMWQSKPGKSPRLKDALVFLECRVVISHDHSDHTIFIAEVEETIIGNGKPLLFYGRQLLSVNENLS